MKKQLALMAGLSAALLLGLTACGGSKDSGATKSKTQTITFINHKTDWAGNGKWKAYMKDFNKKYPNIKVKIETITDYAGQMKTRMNSDQYGDVFMLPDTIKPKDFAHFVAPLGKQKTLEKKYLGLTNKSYNGTSYGIPSQLNASGMVVNMKVFKDAGIKTFPKTPAAFIKALKTIKAKNPDVIPLYTNYAAGWTLANWDFTRPGVVGDPAITNKMMTDKAPFNKGKVMYTIYDTLYKVAKDKLIESDPTTSDWEQSKVDMANNKIGVMVLGSWAVPQIQDANKDNADNITFQTFPATAEDGKQYISVGADYNYAINVHSKHKDAARKLINWLVNDSDYAIDNGGLPTVKGAKYPASLQGLKDSGVTLLETAAAPKGKESLFSEIDDASEIGLDTTDKTKQRIIEAAIGNTNESFATIMKDLNGKWANAIKTVNAQ
ncbi:ABC transporter substrate-binding protein [Lacticaseibacillus suihuaensis]